MSDYFAASHRDELLGENRQLKERIKRLEEAGIAAIHEAVHGREDDALEIWHKAMEGKENHNQQNQEELKERIKRLEEALEGTVKWIVHLADSGDAGFWDVDEQHEIIAARAALKKEDKL